jgi:hypothetical protein
VAFTEEVAFTERRASLEEAVFTEAAEGTVSPMASRATDPATC